MPYSYWSIGMVLISLSKAVSLHVVIPLLSVTHGQCDARPTVTFPACASTKLYCLVTEAHVCEQLAQGCTQKCDVQEPNWRPVDHKSSAIPVRHQATHSTQWPSYLCLVMIYDVDFCLNYCMVHYIIFGKAPPITA